MMDTQPILLPDWLGRCAANRPEYLAIQCEQTRWSFAELDRQVQHLARQLATLGLHEGQRVALLAANGVSYVTFVHALTCLGAVLVPLNTRLTLEELCWQVRDVGAEFLVHDASNAPLAAQIAQTLPSLLLATLAPTAQGD
jgi:O-succinylbenzoic acid--CoA ligase